MSRFFDFLVSTPLALFGAMLLIVVILVRPQEFVPALEGVGLLNLVFGFGMLASAIEIGLGKIRTWWSPQLPWVLAFVLWSYVATIKAVGFGPAIPEVTVNVLFSALFMVIVMYGGRSYARFKTLTVVLIAVTLFLTAISVHQARQELECIKLEVDEYGHADTSVGEPTGKSCDTVLDCEKNAISQADQFECEKAGLFGTFSTGRGRVRWRGKLADPNEMALAMGASLTFAFAMHRELKGKLRHLALVTLLGLVGYCIILSGSRGGQIVFLLVGGTYFVRKMGVKGLFLAGVGAMPLLLMGSRSSEEADASALERIGLLYDGMDMIKMYPLFGVGQNQFQEHAWPPLTAHNSYVLSAAELGLPGMLIWSTLMYLTIKIPVTVAFFPPENMDPRFREYAISLTLSFVGFLVGIFFLSFCFHPLLFIYIGLAGALYGAVRNSAPEFEVRVKPKEIGYLAIADVVIIAVIFVYTRIKGAA